jgi:hypothetical protein
LCAEIFASIKLVKDAAKDTEEIIKLLDKDNVIIPSQLLKDKKLKRPIPDKVFREVKQDGVFVLIPASNSIGIVLNLYMPDHLHPYPAPFQKIQIPTRNYQVLRVKDDANILNCRLKILLKLTTTFPDSYSNRDSCCRSRRSCYAEVLLCVGVVTLIIAT